MKILIVSRWLWEERRRNDNKTGFFGELAQALIAKGISISTILSRGLPAPARSRSAGLLDGQNIHVFSRTGRMPLLMPPDKMIKKFGPAIAKPPPMPGSSADSSGSTARSTLSSPSARNPTALPARSPRSCAGPFPPLITAVHDLRWYNFGRHGVRFTRANRH